MDISVEIILYRLYDEYYVADTGIYSSVKSVLEFIVKMNLMST